jgi:hypothetical protein
MQVFWRRGEKEGEERGTTKRRKRKERKKAEKQVRTCMEYGPGVKLVSTVPCAGMSWPRALELMFMV